MMAFIMRDWQEEVDFQNKPDNRLYVVMDDITLFALLLVPILDYLELVFDILIHSEWNLKLKKCRFLVPNQYFVGIYVKDEGHVP